MPRQSAPQIVDTVFLPADDVILAIGQENAFPWIERDLGIDFDKWDTPVVDDPLHTSPRGLVSSSVATPLSGPKNIIWAVEHGHQAAISIHNHCHGNAVTDRPSYGMNLVTQKMGISEWSYGNDYAPVSRQKMKHVDLVERFDKLTIEVELGFTSDQIAKEVAALPELRYRNAIHPQTLHRMRCVY